MLRLFDGHAWTDQVRPVFAPKAPRKGGGKLIALAVVVAAAAVIAVGAIASSSHGHNHPTSADITIRSCVVNHAGIGTAVVAVTNHSSKRSVYDITIDFSNTGGHLMDDGTINVWGVEHGQTVVRTVDGGTRPLDEAMSSTAITKPTCRVSAYRLSDPKDAPRPKGYIGP